MLEPDGPPEGETTEPGAAPGWLADPFGRFPFRWWDGSAWTGYATAAAGQPVEWDGEPLQAPVEQRPGVPGLWLAVIGAAIGVVLTIVVSRAFDARHHRGPAAIGLPALALWVPLISACLLASRRAGSGSWLRDFDVRIRWVDVGLGLAGSIAARILIGPALSPIPGPVRQLRHLKRSELEAQHLGTSTWIVLALVTCVGAPLVEELFFRGLIQTRLVGRFGPVVGVGLASVIFGAAHLLGWTGPYSIALAWAIAVSGLVLGILRHLTGRLGTSVMAHFFFNAQVIVIAWAFS